MTARLLVPALFGALSWSLLEYLIHRFLGHHPRLRANPFGREHVQHHAVGDYFAPTWKKAIAAGVITAILSVPAIRLAGAGPGLAFVAGLMLFYGAYELLHRREHTHAGIGPYGRWARRHHFYHHFVDARFNHGVTSPIWDFVFGTYRKPAIIRVPWRLRMAWLLDPGTGEIRAEVAGTFVLASRPGAER